MANEAKPVTSSKTLWANYIVLFCAVGNEFAGWLETAPEFNWTVAGLALVNIALRHLTRSPVVFSKKSPLGALLFALALAPCLSPAQLVQTTTPDPATTYDLKLTSDGSTIAALNAWTFHEAYFALPWGLDFYGGWGAFVGTRTSVGSPSDVQAVFGAEMYGVKALGGDGMFVKLSAGVAVGRYSESRSSMTGFVAVGVGKRF